MIIIQYTKYVHIVHGLDLPSSHHGLAIKKQGELRCELQQRSGLLRDHVVGGPINKILEPDGFFIS